MSVDYSKWQTIPGTGDASDQQRDLTQGFYAQIGQEWPDASKPGRLAGWSWTILNRDSVESGGGPAVSEAEAKNRVEDWAKRNLPGWE